MFWAKPKSVRGAPLARANFRNPSLGRADRSLFVSIAQTMVIILTMLWSWDPWSTPADESNGPVSDPDDYYPAFGGRGSAKRVVSHWGPADCAWTKYFFYWARVALRTSYYFKLKIFSSYCFAKNEANSSPIFLKVGTVDFF